MLYKFNTDLRLIEAVAYAIKGGRQSEVYKLADRVIYLNNSIKKGIDLVYEASQTLGISFPKIWAVDVSKCRSTNKYLLFYADFPDEIINKINSIIPKKQVDTPKSVLIKMARSRIRSIRDDIIAHNEMTIESHGNAFGYVPVVIDNIESVEDLDKLCETFQQSRGNHKQYKLDCIRAYEADLKSKKLFDDEVVREAWKYIIIGDIHNS